MPEGKEFLDAASISQKLNWIGLQMRVPEYLANLRGNSRDTNYKDEQPQAGSYNLGHRRSTLVLREEDFEGLRERRSSKYVPNERKARTSIVVLPVNPKQWLLQSLRLQESELQELFDQVSQNSCFSAASTPERYV